MAAAAFSYRTKDNSSDSSDSDDSDKKFIDWKRASRRRSEVPISPQVETPANLITTENTNNSGKRKRNNIWSDVLEDQMMSETLNRCGLKNKPKGYGSRGEESYDYTLKYKFAKRDNDDKKFEEEMSDGSETSPPKFRRNKKFMNRNYVQLDYDGKAAAQRIIWILGEEKHYLIYRVVKFLGIEKAMTLLKMTEEIEDNGGMMVKDHSRRRTPGGVYFQLLKSEKNIEKEVINKIFEGEMNSYEVKKLADERRQKKKLAKQKAALYKAIKKQANIIKTAQEKMKKDASSMIVHVETEQEKMKKDASSMIVHVETEQVEMKMDDSTVDEEEEIKVLEEIITIKDEP